MMKHEQQTSRREKISDFFGRYNISRLARYGARLSTGFLCFGAVMTGLYGANDMESFVPDMSKSDIYLKHLESDAAFGVVEGKKVSSDRIDNSGDEGKKQGFSNPAFDDSTWTSDLVPGNLQRIYLADGKSTPKESWAWGGVAYFRRDFTAPTIKTGERYFLRFDDINGNIELFVNGKFIGKTIQKNMDTTEYKGPRDDYDFDVTDAIVPGKENNITIRFYHSGKPIKPWGFGNTIGILGPVNLDIRPAVFARNILVTPQRDLQTVLVDCIVGGKGNINHWSGEIFEWNSGKMAGTINFAKPKTVEGDTVVSAKATIANPKLWSCESPFLYGIRIKNNAGATVGVKRFGMRTFEAKNGQFLLNGKPIFLRGITHHDQREFGHEYYGNTFGFNTNQNDVHRRYWQAIRNMNINHLRHHSSIMISLAYDLLDEVGIIVCDELAYPTNSIVKPKRSDKIDDKKFDGFCNEHGELESEFKEYLIWRLRYLYSHPSVAMFSFGNEIRPGEYFHAGGLVDNMLNNLYDFYHMIDKQNRPCTLSSGRFWKEGSNMAEASKEKHDYIDTHDYTGTINNLPLGFVQFSLENFISKAQKHYKIIPPIINGECAFSGANYYPWAFDKIWDNENATEPNWAPLLTVLNDFHAKHPSYATMSHYYIRNAGTKGYIYNRFDWGGRYAERILEVHRKLWPAISGYESLCTTMLKKWTSKKDFYPYDFSWEAGPCGKYIKLVNSPCIAVFDYIAPNRFCGENVKTKVHVVNNSEQDLSNAVLIMRMVKDGKDVVKTTLAVGTLKQAENKGFDLSLKMPDTVGYYDLQYTLSDGDKELSTRKLELNLRNKSVVFAPIVTDKRIALYDASAKFGGLKPYSTIKVLKAFSLKYTQINDFNELDKYDILIIGNDSMDNKVRLGSKNIRKFTENGGRVLVFDQNTIGRIPFLPELEYRTAGAGQFSEILRFKHPLLAGMTQRDFFCWNQNDMGIYHTFISPVSEAAITHGGDATTWGADNFGMTNAHLKLGKGDVILTQMEVTKLSNSDSSAAQLVRNLLKTVLDDNTRKNASKFTGYPVVGREPIDEANQIVIPLKAAANMGFADPVAKDGKGGWSDQGPNNDLHSFPVGKREFGGVGFVIQNPTENNGKSCVIVSQNQILPFKGESLPIKVGSAVKRLFFLHSGAWIGGSQAVGEYAVKYQDGTTLSIPLIPGDNIDDWWGAPSKQMKNALCVWSTSNNGNIVGVYLYQWKNPKPETPIENITVKSYGNAMIGLLGLTAENYQNKELCNMKLKSFAIVLLSVAFVISGMAEEYKSEGFSAKINGYGTIYSIAYKGTPLMDRFLVHGEFKTAEDAPKMENFYQTNGGDDKGTFERNGECLTVTTSGSMSNKNINKAVDYKIVTIFSPDEIKTDVSFKNNIDIYSQGDWYLDYRCIMAKNAFFGSGMQVIDKTGKEQFITIPESYDKEFRMGGQSFKMVIGNVILALDCTTDSHWGYQDCRAWKEDRFQIYIRPLGIWTWKFRKFPVGTETKFSFTLKVIPTQE